jgi:hypothetical protein
MIGRPLQELQLSTGRFRDKNREKRAIFLFTKYKLWSALHIQMLSSMGSTLVNSTNHRSKIFRKKSVLNIYRILFFSLFLKKYSNEGGRNDPNIVCTYE